MMHAFHFSILQTVMTVLNPFSQDTKDGEREQNRILSSSWWTNLQGYVANLDRTQCRVPELNLACLYHFLPSKQKQSEDEERRGVLIAALQGVSAGLVEPELKIDEDDEEMEE